MNSTGPKSRRRTGALLLIILALLGLLCLLWPRPASLRPDLLDLLLQIRAELESPGLEIDSAAKKLGDPVSATAFVLEKIRLRCELPGAWLGARGCLRSRVGSPLDKALLLAELLRAQGKQAEILRAPWPDGQPFPKPIKLSPSPRLLELCARLSAEIGTEAGKATRKDRLAGLKGEVEEGFKVFEAFLKEPEAGATVTEKSGRPEWAWVRWSEPGSEAWQDADPVLPELARPAAELISREAPAQARAELQVEALDSQRRLRKVLNWRGYAGELFTQSLSLQFLPGLGRAEILSKIPSASNLPLWVPILKMGKDVTRGDGLCLDGQVVEQSGEQISIDGRPVLKLKPSAPASLTGARLAQASLTQTPALLRGVLDLELSGESLEGLNPLDFKIDFSGKARAARIDSSALKPRPVIVALDVSPSMERAGLRFQLVREALAKLFEVIPTSTQLAFLTFAADIRNYQYLTPLSADRRYLTSMARNVPVREGTCIPEAFQAAQRSCREPAEILIITDGYDARLAPGVSPALKEQFFKKSQEVLSELGRRDDRWLIIGLGEADTASLGSYVEVTKGRMLRLTRDEDIGPQLAGFGQALSGNWRISFPIQPGELSAGAKGEGQLRLSGLKSSIPFKIERPAAAPASPASIRLNLELVSPGGVRQIYRRQLAEISGRGSELLSVHSLGLSLAPIPWEVQAARAVDALIDRLRLALARKGGPFPKEFSHDRGMEAQAVQHHQRLYRSLAIVSPAARWQSPVITLNSRQFIERGPGEAGIRQICDVLSSGYSDLRSVKSRTREGLAIAAFESRSLDGPRLNERLRELKPAPEALERLQARGDWSLPTQGLSAFRSAEKNRIWLLGADGSLAAILDSDRSAKGQSAERIGEDFSKLRDVLAEVSRLGSSGIGGLSGVHGGLFSAICNLFDAQLELWCYASVAMNLVAEEIATGRDQDIDPESGKAIGIPERAVRICEIEADPSSVESELLKASTIGVLDELAEDFLTGAAGQFIGERASDNETISELISDAIGDHFDKQDKIPDLVSGPLGAFFDALKAQAANEASIPPRGKE